MASNPIVSIKQGLLRGKLEETKKGFKFNSFLGIPFAKPPVGSLRFQEPEPAESWQGFRDATQEGQHCYSIDIFTMTYTGSEDCLYVNVFTPELKSSSPSFEPKAVMVWMYGGGFVVGHSKREQYGPEHLIDKDIVLVTFNYRIGILGFLSFEDKSLKIAENAGLKDQALALKWVQQNIKAFGGDPNNVTIFGESAGSASVHLHMLSPLSKGLFHKAIMQSGSALNPWVYGRTNGLSMCQGLGKKITDEAEALKILQETPIEELIPAQGYVFDLITPSIPRAISAIIETKDNKSFIVGHPMEVLSSGEIHKVPALIGYNSEEGLMVLQFEIGLEKDLTITNFESLVPVTLGVTPGSEKAKEIARRIKEFYYGTEEPTKENKHIFYKIMSDVLFVRGIYGAIEESLKHSSEKIYLYRLSLQCELNIFAKSTKSEVKGVAHADDINYLFKVATSPEVQPGSIEDIAIQRMTKLWTNFAKFGDPNGKQSDELLSIKWPALDPKNPENLSCLDIDKELTIINGVHEKNMKFWRSIEKYALSN